MLLDLLRHSDAHVDRLVRAADEEAALGRLGEALKRYELPWSSEVRRRVTVLPGDIRRPHLGLSDERWTRLTHELDSVVGVAAAVDFLRGYQSLRQSNVVGSLTLAELAATGRPKPLHHISSIAVFNEVGITAMGEDDPLAHVDRLAGYDQTKWAAEVALRRARDHGLIVTACAPAASAATPGRAPTTRRTSAAVSSAFGRFRTVPAFSHRRGPGGLGEPDRRRRRPGTGSVATTTTGNSGVPTPSTTSCGTWRSAGCTYAYRTGTSGGPTPWPGWKPSPCPNWPSSPGCCRAPPRQTGRGDPEGPGGRRRAHRRARRGARIAARRPLRCRGPEPRTFERLAQDGLARLPHKDDQPYLWFSETTEGGRPGRSPRRHSLLDGAHPLPREHVPAGEGAPRRRHRRVDVRGGSSEPLVVEHGDLWIRPEEGIPQRRYGATDSSATGWRCVTRKAAAGGWRATSTPGAVVTYGARPGRSPSRSAARAHRRPWRASSSCPPTAICATRSTASRSTRA